MKTCPQCGNSYESAVTFCQRDGEVLEEIAEEMVGRVLDGQYEIESFIARGGMGTLWLARHILLGDRVAIKMLKPEMRSNTEWLRRFQREGRAARRFRHPNAVTVYDLRTGADGLTYMVMEYVEGHSLDRELKRRVRLSPAEVWEILEPIVSALEAAHAQGVVHRDLKPENVMIHRTAAGELQVKLLDLGIAKVHDLAETHAGDGGGASLTLAGQILGTPYYMSPEQWGDIPRDGHAEIDGRADIYSLGVIFYELVTGEKPFTGYTLGELQQAHVSQHKPLLYEVVGGVTAEFARAVEHAMAKDRADRPATAGVFAAEIRAALAGTQEIHLTPNKVKSDCAAAVVLPDLDSSQTLIREKVVSTAAPRAQVETVPQAASASGGATAVERGAAGQFASPSPVAPAHVHAPRAPQARQGSSFKLIAGGALMLLLVVGTVAGGWFAWNRLRARNETTAGVSVAGAAATSAPPARFELIDYWLEAFDDAGHVEGRRIAAKVLSLRSGQQFKFHFTPRERGYLYIIGPGAGNATKTFLTALPVGVLKSNLALADADFIFPYGEDEVLELDKNSGTEEYLIIFSHTPLLAPAFLAERAGRELAPAELKELEDLRARAKTAAPVADVKELGANSGGAASDGGAAASVTVSVGSASAPVEPVVFDIRIEHH